jgi:hypothetical protein
LNQNRERNRDIKTQQKYGGNYIFRGFINLLFTKFMIIKSEELRRAELVARMRVKPSACKVLVRTPGAKIEFGKSTQTRENSIKIDLT